MIILSVFGIVLTIFGITFFHGQYMMTKLTDKVRANLHLTKGTSGYNGYVSPLSLSFTCYVFNVTNPDEVMRGENPNVVEYGPFVYDEILQRHIQDTNVETDEINYIAVATYKFNSDKSVNASREKVTILNPAYMGSIITLTSLPPEFMKKYGNSIPNLFPNRSSIFLKARPVDILFNGIRVTCNVKKFPDLNLLCKIMDSNKRPPVLRETDKEGVYLLSMFQKSNGTVRGPYSVNRGLKNMSLLGDTTSYKFEKVQTIWHSDSCNRVRGSDTITYAPLLTPLSYVTTFITDYCRSVEVDYDRQVSINGITGSKFTMKERVWFLNESQCYCPVNDKKVECLPQGLLDASECQKAPIIFSEPHFLHGDPSLLQYVRGLKPDENLHSTFIVIEPYTGYPLSGYKKVQLNVKLSKQPVDLLANVSEGIVPLLWCADVRIFEKL
ncbi:sensory neuron membrane protein 2 [Nomia melanderi]|uniref:sensory neuron membrane protein 2 n=1 Tax=Nomia melanderi TaxID=2448451 RepID=UPI003FCD0212